MYVSDKKSRYCIFFTTTFTVALLLSQLMLNGMQMILYETKNENRTQTKSDLTKLQTFISRLEEKPTNLLANQVFGLNNSAERVVCRNTSDMKQPCFRFISQKMSWMEAETYCQRFPYSYLVSQLNNNVSEFLIPHIKDTFKVSSWLGAKAGADQVTWVKTNDDALIEVGTDDLEYGWKKLKPFFCLSTDGLAGCILEKPFICEIRYDEPKEIFAPCPFSWTAVGAFCYIEIERSANWTDSERYCNLLGANLMMIKTEETHQALWSAGLYTWAREKGGWRSFHIGLRFYDKEWRWVDTGLEANYTNWSYDYQLFKKGECAFIGDWYLLYAKWLKGPCDTMEWSKCQKRKQEI